MSISKSSTPASTASLAENPALRRGFHPLRLLHSFLTNRFVWTGLALIVELAFLIFLYLFLYSHFLPVTIFFAIISLFVAFYIINHYDNTEMRLLWVFIVLGIPALGPFLYLLFASNRYNNRPIQQKSATIDRQIAQFYQPDPHPSTVSSSNINSAHSSPNNSIPPSVDSPALTSLAAADYSAYLQANYLCSATQTPLSIGNHCRYFDSGEQYFSHLLKDLQTAEHFILLEFFVIGLGQIWTQVLDILRQKVSQGVEVYVMYDDIGSIFALPSHYYRELQNYGIHCTPSNKFNSRINGFQNNRDHRKIIVIDGRIGYTGGINLADEYANLKPRFGHWKDSGLRLEGPTVTNLLTLFLSSWNLHSPHPLDLEAWRQKYPVSLSSAECPASPSSTKRLISPLSADASADTSGWAVAFGSGPKPIYHDPVAKNVYLNLINSAERSLVISTPYLVCDKEILDALALAAEKGVLVRLITPSIPDKKLVHLMTRSNYRNLIDHGVRIYEYQPGFIHTKLAIADEVCALCGTINLDFRSLNYHFENALWLYQSPCIKSMLKDFRTTLKSCSEITPALARQNWLLRTTAEILKVFSPLI